MTVDTLTGDAAAIAKSVPIWSLLPPVNTRWMEARIGREEAQVLRDISIASLRGGIEAYEAGELFYEELHPVLGRNRRFFEFLSGHIISRARTFGQLVSLREAGATTYEIDAVTDDRTTQICDHLDGRHFPLTAGVEIANALLDISEPADILKVVQWLTPEELASADQDELIKSGFALPPFHDGCRSGIVIALS